MGEAAERDEGGHAAAVLDLADLGGADADARPKLGLGEAADEPKLTNPSADKHLQSHRYTRWAERFIPCWCISNPESFSTKTPKRSVALYAQPPDVTARSPPRSARRALLMVLAMLDERDMDKL